MEKRLAKANRAVVLASLATAWLFAAWGLAVYGDAAAARPHVWETSLAGTGTMTHRDPAGPLDALGRAPPGALVLIAPPPLLASERAALSSYAEAGGTVLIVGLHPENALATGLASQMRVLPGAIYGPLGGQATFRASDTHDAFARSGARAILADAVGARAILTADAGDVRDTNADGVLEPGEPTGPFTVAVSLPSGHGQIVLLAVDPSAPGTDATPYSTLLPGAPRDAIIVDYQDPGAWARPMQTAVSMLSAVPQTWWIDAVLAGIVMAGALILLAPARAIAPRVRSTRDLVEATRARMRGTSTPATDPFWRALEETPS